MKPDSSAVLDLRLAAAWSYLTQKNAAELDAPTQKNTAEIEKTIQKNAAELEKQRALLRQSESKADPAFHVIEAVAALQDGQLEKGLAELYQSRYQSAASAAELLVQTYANAALGRFEPALADLERLDRYYEKNQTLPPEQQILAKCFWPRPHGCRLRVIPLPVSTWTGRTGLADSGTICAASRSG